MDSMAKITKHPLRWLGIAVVAVDAIFFSATNPDNVSSLSLFSGYLLLTATLFYLAWAILSFAQRSGFSIGLHERKAGLGVAGLIALLIALQSVGQLGVRDIAVAVPFAVLGYLYISYNQPTSETNSS